MDRRLAFPALLLLTMVLLVTVALSLQWRMQHDVPIFVYLAWLIDTQGVVPYRDLFDYNLPGTYAAHILIGRLFGYGDMGARIADLLLLATLSGTTFAILRRFGVFCGWFAVLAFGLWYLSQGPMIALQRDYLALVPISAAILAALSERGTPLLRATAMGFLLGLATTVKPYALVGWPWLVLWLAYEARAGAPEGPGLLHWLVRVGLAAGAGLAVPLLTVVAYVVAAGAWTAFVDIVVNYWPLYGAINGDLQVLPDGHRSAALLARFRNEVIAPNGWRLDVAAIGVGLALLPRAGLSGAARRRVVALAGLVLVYALYPMAGGKFWVYHTFPFVYATLLAGALSLLPMPARLPGAAGAPPGSAHLPGWLARQIPGLAAIALLMFEAFPMISFAEFQADALQPPKSGAPDAIAAYLTAAHLQSGDRVQPLDWTGGAVHGLLEARALLATPYVYDEQFHHAVSTAYVQGLRADFVTRLTAQPPRFVVEILKNKPTVWGVDTSQEFPALADLLRSDYTVAVATKRYKIYEHRTAGPHSG